MIIQKGLYFFITAIFITACTNGNPLQIPEVPADFLKGKTKLNSDFFLIGPEIDSVNVEIAAACDCCASDLAFLNDSSFIYTSLCLGGDSYVKGNYVVFGNLLILHTDKEAISSEYDMSPEAEDSSTKYEMIRQERAYHVYEISYLNEKQVIAYSSQDKDNYVEYGMPTQGSLKDLREEFRKEKILKRFLEDE